MGQALTCRKLEQGICFVAVPLHTQSVQVEIRQIVLTLCKSLIRGHTVVSGCLFIALFNAAAACVAFSKLVLSVCISLFSSFPE